MNATVPHLDLPADAPNATVFQWLRLPSTRSPSRSTWGWLTVLVLFGWIGSTAFIGAFRSTEVSRLLGQLGPLPFLYWFTTLAAAVLALIAWRIHRVDLAGAAATVAAFLAGHGAYERIHPLLPGSWSIPFESPGDWLGFAVLRLGYAAAVLAVCLPVWWLVYRRRAGFPTLAFGHGDWSVRGRDFIAREKPSSWGRRLMTGYLAFALIFFILMQANVGFAPIRNGSVVVFMPAILGAAFANAIAEEAIFRGILQPAFVRFGGIAAGVWMQGLLFGLLHWGNSVGLLAALPVSLLIGLGSVVWGKAALETRGLTWVIVAHALLDVGIMSAFFVPH